MDNLNAKQHRSVRSLFRDMKLRTAFVLYTLAALALSLVLYTLISNGIGNQRWRLRVKYEEQAVKYQVPVNGSVLMYYDTHNAYYIIKDQDQKRVSEFTVDYSKAEPLYEYDNPMEDYLSLYTIQFESLTKKNKYTAPEPNVSCITVFPVYSDQDKALDVTLQACGLLSAPVVFSAAVALSGMLFYRRRLRKPIRLLFDASAKIADNDLDFSISYNRDDEMGRLCKAFETMRHELSENQHAIWQQIDERKRLNAAFSHDLRTPLTVLKGHTSMILSSVSDDNVTKSDIAEEVVTMSTHIGRLENYVEAMAKLQRLEDIELHGERVQISALSQTMRETAEILTRDKRLRFLCDFSQNATLSLDREVVLQVFENLITNAARYAKESVTVTVRTTYNQFYFIVSDDGIGFTARDLLLATQPFYRAGGSKDPQHLGLGLHICRILCERHDGKLTIQNGTQGGGEITAVFNNL